VGGTTAVLSRPRPPVTDAPPAGTWAIDPGRARVAFSGRAGFLAPTISARFPEVAGAVVVGGPTDRIRVEVDVTSMTTGNPAYDELIAVADPFDAARFPIAVYESDRVRWSATGADVEGRLTLRGRTATVALTASYDTGRAGCSAAPGARMVVRAAGTVDREAFGLRFDLPGLGRLVPRQLRLDVDVDVVLLEPVG